MNMETELGTFLISFQHKIVIVNKITFTGLSL